MIDLATKVTKLTGGKVHKTPQGELSVQFSAIDLLVGLRQLKGHLDLQFRQLMDICAVDYLGREKRFEVVYHLLSLQYNQRIRVKVSIALGDAVPSAVGVYKNADWYEREAFDLFGIHFEGHPDLRRLLTDYGFEGHPLRKDFPLTGYVEPRYDDSQKRLFMAPWYCHRPTVTLIH